MIGLPNLSTMLIAKSSVALNLLLIGAVVLLTVGHRAELRVYDNVINHPSTGYKAQVRHLTQDLTSCRGSNVVLKSSLASQNNAIDELARASEANAVTGKIALEKVRVINRPLDLRITEALRSMPQSLDLCKEVDNLVLRSVK